MNGRGPGSGVRGSVRAALRAWVRRAIFRPRHPWLHPVECAWCRTYRPGQPPRIVAWSTVKGSHGICPECRGQWAEGCGPLPPTAYRLPPTKPEAPAGDQQGGGIVPSPARPSAESS